MAKVKTKTIQSDDADSDNFRAPANHYIVNAFGEYVFISARKREAAQTWVDEEYGPGKYTVRVWKI